MSLLAGGRWGGGGCVCAEKSSCSRRVRTSPFSVSAHVLPVFSGNARVVIAGTVVVYINVASREKSIEFDVHAGSRRRWRKCFYSI